MISHLLQERLRPKLLKQTRVKGSKINLQDSQKSDQNSSTDSDDDMVSFEVYDPVTKIRMVPVKQKNVHDIDLEKHLSDVYYSGNLFVKVFLHNLYRSILRWHASSYLLARIFLKTQVCLGPHRKTNHRSLCPEVSILHMGSSGN